MTSQELTDLLSPVYVRMLKAGVWPVRDGVALTHYIGGKGAMTGARWTYNGRDDIDPETVEDMMVRRLVEWAVRSGQMIASDGFNVYVGYTARPTLLHALVAAFDGSEK